MSGHARDLGEWTCTFPGCTSPPRHEHVFTPSELAAHDAAIRAEAWDEGWLASKRHERGEGQPKMTYWPNPYRQALRAARPTEGES